MIPRILHTVWLGPEPLSEEPQWSNDWECYLWDENTVHQLGLEPHQWEHATFAGSSNIIRLHALRLFGGIYMDTDFDNVRPARLEELLQYPAWACRQPDGVLCNAAFGATPDHPWVRAMINFYGDQRLHDAARGCYVMEPCLTPDVIVLPSDYFYCNNFDRPLTPPTERTVARHLWSASWVAK